MDPPKMLLESTFLRAIADPDDDHHERAVGIYLLLLQQYEDRRILLVAVSDHLRRFRTWRHVGALAPVDELYVGFQHRRAAHRVVLLVANDDPDRALTLVMCERHSVTQVATFDPLFAAYDLELTPSATAALGSAGETSADETSVDGRAVDAS